MYCSSCGLAVARGLSYCNHCGAKLNRAESEAKSSELRPEFLLSSMAALFIFGLIGITVLMGVMKSVLGLPVEKVLGFSVLPFLMMLALEGILLRLLSRRMRSVEETRDTKLANEQVTNELDAAQARVLPEPRGSVTEHTTRAFDPIYREPSE